MVSVICCYNNIDLYNQLLCSLETQDIPFEIIGIRNDGNEFSSASAALNYGATKASKDVFVFLHQDILFLKSDGLRKLTELVRNKPDDLIAVGLYGASKNKKRYDANYQLQDTLDECCVAMSRKTWETINFNETICDGWHLYVVEFCIRLRNMHGIVLSGDFDIQHLSNGIVDEKYMTTYKRLLRVYKEEKWLCTTCKSMPNNLGYYYIYYFLWRIKKVFFGNWGLMFNLKRFISRYT